MKIKIYESTLMKHIKGSFLTSVRMAEWSKALRSGRSPLSVGVGSNPTSDKCVLFYW